MLPSTQDYKIALMIGADSFRTLENVEVMPNPAYPDEPWYSTGGLAIVFKIKLNGKTYALKCFHKDSVDRQYRLEKIAEYICNNPSPYWVDFQYLENELWVETNGLGSGYPVVLMEWIEGHTLDNFLAEKCDINEADTADTTHKRMILKGLYLNFVHLAKWLYDTPIAHGDLKHDNILVDEFGQLKLIDYDGMYIPEFSGLKATELGSPCYQHPYRTREWFDELLDCFSIRVIHATLYLLKQKPGLFKDFYNGDGILFKDTDFTNPQESEITALLKRTEEQDPNHYLKEDLALSLIFKKITFNAKYIKELELERYRQQQNTLFIVEDIIKNHPEWKQYHHRLKNSRMILGFKLPDKFMNFTNFYPYSKNEEFYWTADWIDLYADLWDWRKLSSNSSLLWDIGLIERFEDQWYWLDERYGGSNYLFNEGLSYNSFLPWTIELIEKYYDKWDWARLSSNSGLPWSIELTEKYYEKWDWPRLSWNSALPWSVELIEKYYDKWDSFHLSMNKGFPWSSELIEKYVDKWSWPTLSRNSHLPWSMEFIEKYYNRWVWPYLSENPSLPWSIELIEKYYEKWDWKKFLDNSGLPWSIELIEEYYEKWDWPLLSRNKFLPWCPELIEKFLHRWHWDWLLSNSFIPWSNELIKKFSHIIKSERKLSEHSNIGWFQNWLDLPE